MMKGVFGHLYSGMPVDDINVADIISVSLPQDLQEEAENTEHTTELGSGQLRPEVRNRIEKRKQWFFNRDGPQPPITEEESEEISRQVEAARDEMRAVEARITRLQGEIEQQIAASSVDGVEPAINLDTKKKQALKRAIRKLFGRDMTRITLSDYKALLQARTAMEQEAVLDYARDFPEG